jgi:hypothetical protein
MHKLLYENKTHTPDETEWQYEHAKYSSYMYAKVEFVAIFMFNCAAITDAISNSQYQVQQMHILSNYY